MQTGKKATGQDSFSKMCVTSFSSHAKRANRAEVKAIETKVRQAGRKAADQGLEEYHQHLYLDEEEFYQSQWDDEFVTLEEEVPFLPAPESSGVFTIGELMRKSAFAR